jgi:hypothetical protein
MGSGYRKVRAYLRVACTVGVVLSVAACSSDMTAPQHIVSITSSQDTMTIGALRFTGAIAIIDTAIQVSVTVKNDSTVPVSYTSGVCDRNHIGFALYRNAARSGTPVLDLQPQTPTCEAPSFIVSLAPGDSTTLTNTFLPSQVRQVVSGMYYVAAPLTNFGTYSYTINAGMLMISD